MNSDLFKITIETQEHFQSIAEKLMNKCAILSNGQYFRLTEIEFYWNSDKHKDSSVYKRRHAEPNHGEWFFHYSGVDIALRNDETKGYGGILIRSIVNTSENNKTYKGPMVCAMRLFSGQNVFSDYNGVKLIPHDFPYRELKKSPRIGLGKNAIESGTDQLKYRFNIDVNGK